MDKEKVNAKKLKTILIACICFCVVITALLLVYEGYGGEEPILKQTSGEKDLNFEIDSFLGRAVRFGFESEYSEGYKSSAVRKYAVKTLDEFNSAYLTLNIGENEITSYTLSVQLYKTELEKELDDVEYDNNQKLIKLNDQMMSLFDKWNSALLRAFDKEAKLSDAQLKYASEILRKAYNDRQTQKETVGAYELYAVYEDLNGYESSISFSASKY